MLLYIINIMNTSMYVHRRTLVTHIRKEIAYKILLNNF